jgi:hypothetical protein
MLLVKVLQVGAGDMRVNLRCGNICMAEHRLDGAQVSAPLEQMRCKKNGEAYAA